MNYESILVDKDKGICTVTLNRPKKLNALTPKMRMEIREALEDADTDEGVKVIILTGAGRGFCSGLDVTPHPGQEQNDYAPEEMKWMLMHPQSRARGLPGQRTVPEVIRALRKPTICAVNGVMAGAGSGFALSCDIIIASEKASFLVATTRIGLVLEFDTSFLLPMRVGTHRALELAYTNDRISADEMERIGLINKVVPHDQLMLVAKEMAEKMFLIPPLSLALVKRCVYADVEAARNVEAQRIFDIACEAALAKTKDQAEATASFWEKRSPLYTGG
jgi:2-(1,2-epoxy-1,2-dihydrophenyl)acetyl-CoA isomerase